MVIGRRLALLREKMQQEQIDLYLVPTVDEHNSEYVPQCYARRAWISGFDGSAGVVMVSLSHAYLWTDGRYFLQAEQQLDSAEYTLIKQAGWAAEIEQWLTEHGSHKSLGIDPRLVSAPRVQALSERMHDLQGKLVIIEGNLIDACRKDLGVDVAFAQSAAFYLPEQFTGESLAQKLSWLRGELRLKKANYIALNVLDEQAWLFNIRANDIEYNPLLISYALIGENSAHLFVDRRKISKDLSLILEQQGVSLADYAEFAEYLAKISGVICLDEHSASYWMLEKARINAQVLKCSSPIVHKKALKNPVEIAGAKNAHIKDALAVINFLYKLEKEWHTGIDEIAASEQLAQFRALEEHARGPSFATISGYAANGAIIHYNAKPETSKLIKNDNLYLLDSGGQYLDGTTDITRTIHLGVPSVAQRRHYTLVLKGHLALGRVVFPHGTCGEHLDVLARAPLWQEYLNYRHGTGHGVGSFLCVHEGPQRISPAISNVPLLPGMIVSNEPGVYFAGAYGIRIENLCLVVQDSKSENSEYGAFYRFDDLTLVPYCKKLIDVSILNAEEKQQIFNYYQKIRQKIAPRLAPPQQQWLEDELDLF